MITNFITVWGKLENLTLTMIFNTIINVNAYTVAPTIQDPNMGVGGQIIIGLKGRQNGYFLWTTNYSGPIPFRKYGLN